MKIIRILFFSLLFCPAINSQNLIGYKADDIKEYMRENQKQMSLNNVNNKSYRYLKYSDSGSNSTILFFLDSDSVCNNIRIICDKRMKINLINEYNTLYSKSGENLWIDFRQGKKIRIELTDEEFLSVISIKPDK